MAWLTLNLTITLGRENRPETADRPVDDGTPVETSIELSGAPERPQMGFVPLSDPTRKNDEGWY